MSTPNAPGSGVNQGAEISGPPPDASPSAPVASSSAEAPPTIPMALPPDGPGRVPVSSPQPPPQPLVVGRRHGLLAAGLVVALGVVGVGGVVGWYQHRSGDNRPAPSVEPATAQAAGQAFLAAWQTSNYSEMQALVYDQSDNMERIYHGMSQRLHLAEVQTTPGPMVSPPVVPTPSASASGSAVPTPSGSVPAATTALSYTADLSITGLSGKITYASAVPVLKDVDGHYRVAFTPATVYPGLTTGQRLDLVSRPAPAPTIMDRTGTVELAGDPDLSVNLVGVPANDDRPATGLYRVVQAGANSDGSSAADATLSASASAASAEVDLTYGGRVVVADAATGKPVRTVTKLDPTAPGPAVPPVKTTLDLSMQRAATQALAKAPGVSAMVVLDSSSGEVRSIVNKPTTGVPPAITGKYPPGSTFKIITATAAVNNGLTADSPLTCPATKVVDGRPFVNYENEEHANLSFTEAFAMSCNTAFIGAALGLPDDAIKQTAELFGFNAINYPLPVGSFGGSFPQPRSETERAASAIGQGRVTASPLQMASVAAAISSGTWHQPHLLPCEDCASHNIAHVEEIRTMMRQVVTSGTGVAAAKVPGGPVYGKTGTAEFGTDKIPATHAWFVGYQGTNAFAVFVYEGSSGGAVAAPIAADFLRRLH